MFVNRKKELKMLKNAADAFIGGKRTPLALIGLRRIGKTELIQRFRKERHKILMPYLNLQGSASSPQTFAEDFYISMLEEAARLKNISFSEIGKKTERIINLSTLLGEGCYNLSMKFLNVLNSGNYAEIIQTAFQLPEAMCACFKNKMIIFMDEFQELDSLNNYKFGDVFKIMRSIVEKQENTMYVVCGSVISFMENLIRGSREPFFNQFTELRLTSFTREDSIVLAKMLLKKFRYGKKMLDELFRYSYGHPFYITSICERLIIEASDENVDEKFLKYAAMKEILDKDGKINILFRYIFEESLKKAKKAGYLKNILTMLAEKEGMNLTEISAGLGKPSGQVSNYLKSLLKTDLVFENEKKYFFRDPIFRFWTAKTQLGKNIEIERKERFVDELLNDFKEKYLRVSTELGKAKEYELKYKLEKAFGLKLENYMHGKVEFDLVGAKEKIWFVFEIKWKTSPASYNDLSKFLKNAQNEFTEPKLFFISKSGFTHEAKKFAEKNKIKLLSDI